MKTTKRKEIVVDIPRYERLSEEVIADYLQNLGFKITKGSFDGFIDYLKDDFIRCGYICDSPRKNAMYFLQKLLNCFDLSELNVGEVYKLIKDSAVLNITRISEWNISEIDLVNDLDENLKIKCCTADFRHTNKWGYASMGSTFNILHYNKKVIWVNRSIPDYFVLSNDKIYGVSYYDKRLTIYDNLENRFNGFATDSNTALDKIISAFSPAVPDFFDYSKEGKNIKITEIDLSPYFNKGTFFHKDCFRKPSNERHKQKSFHDRLINMIYHNFKGGTPVPKEKLIIGAVAGDIIGSVYEVNNVKTVDFDLFCRNSTFTDDSVLTVATMTALMKQESYTKAYQFFGKSYPDIGFGFDFCAWIDLHYDNPKPYNSCGNGSAMRVSPVGWYGSSLDEVMAEAQRSAEVTHNHPEGVKGAQSVAVAIYMARTGKTKDEIKQFITDTFHYDLDRKIDDIRPNYDFAKTCQGSVPEAIIAFLESTDFENAIRLAISLGGDSDTIACIAGAIAEAYYQSVPEYIVDNVIRILPKALVKVVDEFSRRYRG